jgi:hypothetical protein
MAIRIHKGACPTYERADGHANRMGRIPLLGASTIAVTSTERLQRHR